MRNLGAIAFALVGAWLSIAATFPALTGRVVDGAHMLSPATIAAISGDSQGLEQKTGTQFVVATIPSLNGQSIEDYGYQLGRHWGIGQKGQNNGAILIVAPNDRKVRIEVGYGLEGTLTDAQSSQIIQGIILPRFRQGQMEQGVLDGSHAITAVLGGDPNAVAPTVAPISLGATGWLKLILFGIFLLWILSHPRSLLTLMVLSMFSRGGSRGGDGDGGFSGGGGSFGGGGSSGSW